MDVYQIWFSLRPETDEREFSDAIQLFLNHLKQNSQIETWRLLRCKLGLRPEALDDFLLLIETKDLAQLDKAFQAAAAREGLTDQYHYSVNRMVQNVKFALYRDWPDKKMGK